MLKLIGSEDYYPTPAPLLAEITEGLDWEQIEYVLEPSAGKGDIASYVQSAKAVIESFEGRESYTETVMERQYYLFDAIRAMPMLRE